MMINADKSRIEIPIDGMDSENCALIIGNAIKRLNGIGKSIVEYNNRRALLYGPENDVLKSVIKEIRNLGYEVITGKKNIPVLNMSCASCAVSVESMTKSLTGVIDASVNFASATLSIEYLPNMIGTDAVQNAVQSIGFDLLVDDPDDTEILENIRRKKYALLKQRLVWSLSLSLPVVIIGMFFMDMPYANIIMWVLSTPVIFWIGKDFFINAWKKAKHRSANMDTLVALSTSVAYFFSMFNTLFPDYWHHTGLHGHVYFEAPAVIISFILLGKLLEEKAKAGTSSALKKLMGLQPKTATVVSEDGVQTETPIEQLHKGDVILVKPGERIAVDGIVIEGYSYVDESMMSGESFPVLKTVSNFVYAGTVNQKGSFRFRAEKLGKETRLAYIIGIVRDAQGSKAPVQKMVDRIAGVFVPVIIAIALLTFLAWFILGGENGFSFGIFAFVTVLVIACPCALGLATPTAIMVGIGKGAEHGILIKDAESLEMAKNITTVVMDKTGTITEGKPAVTDIAWYEQNDSRKDILLSIEKLSEHPIADAIVNSFENVPAVPVSEFESITGKGVKALVNNKLYFCGNSVLLHENNIQVNQALLKKSEEWSNVSKTVIWFSDEHQALSVMAVSDQIKESSVEAIRKMKDFGLELIILTGDNRLTAQAVAEKTGIDSYKAEMLPEEKTAFVKQLQSEGKIVAMVGDGINDSAALAMADVSISPGNGSDIAMDVAKMTIISSDLNKILTAIKLSKQTVATIHQNLWWAFLYNIIGIPIAAGILYPITGLMLNPMIAGAAMALSSVSVVSNSLRLKRKKL